MRSRRDARSEWVQGHLAEAVRIATLLTADPVAGPRVAEESLEIALEAVPRRRRERRLADALLAELVRGARGEGAAASQDLPEQLEALGALPRRQRAALVLRHYAELSPERAAVFLDCSPRAVEDLAGRAVRSLPADARTDVHDWLDSAPLPRVAPPPARRPGLRALLRRRAFRTAAAATAVAAGVAGGLRLPALLREPEPPTRAEQLTEIRRVLESQEANLPFDPDDPGPGASRMFPVDNGTLGGTLWSVTAYRDPDDRPCLQVVAGSDFGRRRCLTAARAPIRAVVDLDRDNEATFISGLLVPGIEELHFEGPGVPWMDVTIGRQDPEASGRQPGFFGIALPDEFVAVASREAGREGGYEVLPGRLTGLDARGDTVARVSLFLARA
ncbi:MAG TPA: sigma factor-like helix-turn-helix DNA-binding protein [Actinomycetota bacterium]|nr:sigma factor-like helix-turn-helix DNA-binding protein [Actinomycetota bacterium]